ncbi:MAG: tetratricopeptide repeat-containing glycosyltransferase family protein [Rhodospirillaceae bacterium]|nr:tetratricopeptide repeat-containing glycosyltransferase family protein [Rhodospirillaceae bacterium]
MNRKQRRASATIAPESNPAFLEPFNLGLQLQQLGHLEQSAAAYRKAMKVNPNVALLYNNLGVVVYNQGNLSEAVALQKKAIALDPTLTLAYNNLGVALNAMNRLPEALAVLAKAVKLAPNDPQPINNYGDTLVKLSRFAEGAEALHKALAMDPNYVEAFTNLGTALWGLGRIDEAVECFHRALALKPDTAMAHKNLGIVSLLKGDFVTGWREYNWRWLADKIVIRQYPVPVWQGQPLGDGALLVWAEQGVGDEILQASMIGDLLARGIKVVWEVDPRMAALFRRSFPTATKIFDRVLPPITDRVDPGIAAHIAAGSMGEFIRRSYDDFPRERRSYLMPDRARAEAFRARLGLAPGERLVGISWLSKNVAFGESKSTQLEAWIDILKTPGLKFVDLQYGDTHAERRQFQKRHGITVAHLDDLDLRDDLDGLAALISVCDLVVTVSNSTAHFAGALGVPVWIMIPAGVGKFWYWGLSGETNPWYPSATLIRQGANQDWRPVLAEVAARLANYAAHSA